MYVYVGDVVEVIKAGLHIVDTAEEYAKLKICQLYKVTDGEETYPLCIINDANLKKMLQSFAVMMKEYKTVISQNIWNYHVQKHSILPLPEVATKIWSPAIEDMKQLIEKLCDKSVTLKEIDNYLEDILAQNLEEEIQRFVEGYKSCFDKTVSTAGISRFVITVNFYRNICNAQRAAQLILDVKDALMLTGNFEELKEFKSKVSCNYIIIYIYIYIICIYNFALFHCKVMKLYKVSHLNNFLLNPLTRNSQQTGIIIIIKCKHQKRKHQKTGFQCMPLNKLP